MLDFNHQFTALRVVPARSREKSPIMSAQPFRFRAPSSSTTVAVFAALLVVIAAGPVALVPSPAPLPAPLAALAAVALVLGSIFAIRWLLRARRRRRKRPGRQGRRGRRDRFRFHRHRHRDSALDPEEVNFAIARLPRCHVLSAHANLRAAKLERNLRKCAQDDSRATCSP